jgi:hypothetical protein
MKRPARWGGQHRARAGPFPLRGGGPDVTAAAKRLGVELNAVKLAWLCAARSRRVPDGL